MLSNSVILLRHHISACTSVHVWRYQVILFSLCINSSVIALRYQSSRISYNLRLLSNIFPLQILSEVLVCHKRCFGTDQIQQHSIDEKNKLRREAPQRCRDLQVRFWTTMVRHMPAYHGTAHKHITGYGRRTGHTVTLPPSKNGACPQARWIIYKQ